MNFNAADTNLFFTKNDPQDLRLGDLAKAIHSYDDVDSQDFVIAGYPDDEGIKLNKGRVGSGKAPDLIRKYLYKMTPHLLSTKNPGLKDIGNLDLNFSLEERHELVKQSVSKVLKKRAKWIGLGGGHDYGYPDGAAFLENSERPLIINFDAHLDVRSTEHGFTSGTPFYRILSEYGDIKNFDFLEVGIQSQCNSKIHYEWALEHKAKILTWDEISRGDPTQKILQFLEPFILKNRDTFLSVDIDGFSSNYAMGCSQSFATGFSPSCFFKVFQVLCERLDPKVLGIYEVSPPLDLDDKTSKLAALIVHNFIYSTF